MKRTMLLLKAVAAVAALTLILAACSSSSDSSTTTDTTTTEAPTSATEAPTSAAAEGTPVAVAVGETDVQHMYMTVDPTTAPAGTVTFTVVNEGVKKHEFVILSTDVMAADLPLKGDEVVEDDYNAIDEIGELPPGETHTLTVDLEPGHYALICNLKGHVRMGMYADITVE
ncbi:MAG: cupredoxin domain-containing protein [Actinomycetota bacterium]